MADANGFMMNVMSEISVWKTFSGSASEQIVRCMQISRVGFISTAPLNIRAEINCNNGNGNNEKQESILSLAFLASERCLAGLGAKLSDSFDMKQKVQDTFAWRFTDNSQTKSRQIFGRSQDLLMLDAFILQLAYHTCERCLYPPNHDESIVANPLYSCWSA